MRRIELSQVAVKGLKWLIVVYVIVSICYTGTYLYASYDGVHHDSGAILPRGRELISNNQEPMFAVVPELPPAYDDEHRMVWSTDKGAAEAISERFLMAKVFSDALGPSNLRPYFYRGKATFDKEDITMATLVTRDRFHVLSRLASNHRGPISAAVHINDHDDIEKNATLRELRDLYAANPDMQLWVDVHLIIDKYSRQFNMWRNIAKLFTRTDYLMMLDVDFHICTDVRNSIRSNPDWMKRLREGHTAFVVPAFEFNVQEEGEDWHTFPTTKADLLELIENNAIGMFHKAWLKGHGATNYTHWYDSDHLYKVMQYEYSYEPYIIFKKESSPWCDERFIGYGANKAACLYEIYLSGIEYWVLPNDFLIHQTHRYPEDTRRRERQYNRKLYMNFREELCLRYARKFYMAGDWDTPRADNLKTECDKIHGFRRTVLSTAQ